MTLLAVVNCPRSQEDMVSNWQPTHSLLDDELSVAEIAAAPLFSGFCCKTPASLPLALGGVGGGGVSLGLGGVLQLHGLNPCWFLGLPRSPVLPTERRGASGLGALPVQGRPLPF